MCETYSPCQQRIYNLVNKQGIPMGKLLEKTVYDKILLYAVQTNA